MKVKKKIYAVSVILFFLVTFVISVYSVSKDNFFNKTNNYPNKIFMKPDIVFDGWNEYDGTLTSVFDPQIILNGADCYVHSVRISGSSNFTDEKIRIFYTEKEGEYFSPEKTRLLDYNIINGGMYIYPDMYVYSLRLDITEDANVDLTLKNVELNDNSIVFSFTGLVMQCLFPTILFAAVLGLIIFGSALSSYVQVFKKFIPLLQNLISRDLKVKYRRSVLGFLWSILNPLLMALVLNIVFSKLFRFQVEYFATYYLTGALMFNFVIECTTGSMMSVISAAPLIKKVYIPKYLFPMQKCAFAFINMLFSSVAVVVVILIQGVPFHAHILLFIVPMLYALVFAYGMGLILAAMTVFFRDIEHLYSVWTTIWMYLTPIIYPEELLQSSGLAVITKLNPMYYYVHSLRNVVMYGTFPSAIENIMCITFAIVSLALGLCLFKKVQDKFILYI